MSSSSSPHARHLALLTLPILLRYPFRRKCVSQSCVIALAAILESLRLLIDLRNLVDSVVLLIASVAILHFEVLHSSCHSLARLSISKKEPACICTYYALLCLAGTHKAFVRKFSVRSISQVKVLQNTYNQLIL